MHHESGLFEEILELLADSQSIDESLSEVLSRVLSSLELDVGAIFLLDTDRGLLTRKAGQGISERILESGAVLPLGEGIIGAVAQEGRRIVVQNTSDDPRVTIPALSRDGIGSFVAEPIRTRERVLGVITAASAVASGIGEGQISTLRVAARQIGIAIENAELLIRWRQSEALFRNILENSPDLSLLCNPALDLVRTNAAGYRFFGLEPSNIEGVRLRDLLGDDRFQPFLETKNGLVRGRREGGNFEITLIDEDGEQHFFEFRSTLLREQGNRFFIHFVGRDLTKRKDLESKLLEYADRLEEMVKKKNMRLRDTKNQIEHLFVVSSKITDLNSVQQKLDLIANSIPSANLFRKVCFRLSARADGKPIQSHVGYDVAEIAELNERLLDNPDRLAESMSDRYRIGRAFFLPSPISQTDSDHEAGRWRSGDRLLVPLTGEDEKPLGFAVVEQPHGNNRPDREMLLILDLFIEQATQAVEDVRIHRRLAEADRMRNEWVKQFRMENIVGSTEPMQVVFEAIRKLAKVRSSVLITGESGTGKELVASAIHFNGLRRGRPFIKVNCAAIPEALLESELFGIEKRVATGVDLRIGKFEQANGGTLLLDEVADMSRATQAKVLRALQERVVERVGGTDPIPVDVRIIAATNRDLGEMMEGGQFRRDLFYRLHVVAVQLPPLRERVADIPDLVDHLLARCCREQNLVSRPVSREVMRLFADYPWPGNVRQLHNCLERALVLGRDTEEITLRDLPPSILAWKATVSADSPPGGGIDLGRALENFEREMILDALRRSGWVQSRAAKLLGISERAIWYRVKKLKIPIPA